jgi:hypothetical protein
LSWQVTRTVPDHDLAGGDYIVQLVEEETSDRDGEVKKLRFPGEAGKRFIAYPSLVCGCFAKQPLGEGLGFRV